MRKPFYLNIDNVAFLKQKCIGQKYAKGIKLDNSLNNFLPIDMNNQIVPNRVASLRRSSKQSVFLKKDYWIKLNFFRDFFFQTNLSKHQLMNQKITEKFVQQLQILNRKKFLSIILLSKVFCGFRVLTGAASHFLPQSHMRFITKTFRRKLFPKKNFLFSNPKFFLKKALIKADRIRPNTSFGAAYWKKNFVKRRRFWSGYKNFLLLLNSRGLKFAEKQKCRLKRFEKARYKSTKFKRQLMLKIKIKNIKKKI